MPCWLERVVRQPPPRRPQLPLGGILTNIIMTLAGMPMGKALQGQVAGKVTAMGDPAYEDLRRALVWNELAPARRPKLICQAGSKWRNSVSTRVRSGPPGILRRRPFSEISEEIRFAMDSPLEEAGFELPVPPEIQGLRPRLFRCIRPLSLRRERECLRFGHVIPSSERLE